MKRFPRLRFLFLHSAGLLLAALFAGRAQAGSLHVRDDAHVLSADDAGRLRSVLAAAPFDGRLAVTSEYADPQGLSRYAGSLLTEPNMVAVVIDPQHHHVQVHFGTGSRVPRAEWATIEQAGNDAFRRADWEGGAAAIFRASASAAAGAVVGAADETAPAQAQGARTSFLGPVVFLVLAGGIGIAYLAWRRSTYNRYGAPNGSNYGPGGGPYPGQGYPPPYPGAPQGGLGPLGGGLIGAGLGGLAGYELGKIEGDRERAGHERPLDNASVADEGGGNFDAGGGGSSWGDDGGDSGGGGFDGGGGDSGGGGSDF